MASAGSGSEMLPPDPFAFAAPQNSNAGSVGVKKEMDEDDGEADKGKSKSPTKDIIWAKGRGKGDKKERGGGKQKVRVSVKCKIPACGDDSAEGSPYCWRHKRAFGRICKHSQKGKKAKTDEYINYTTIFGEGRNQPPDPDLACKVIEEVADQMSDGEECDGGGEDGNAAKRQKVVGNRPINLGQYVHSQGSRVSSEEVNSRPKLDFELFTAKLKHCRGWNTERITAKWLQLKSVPSNYVDDRGQPHPVHGCTRLRIPPDLIGEEREEHRSGGFEERRLDAFNKAHKMDDAQKRAWLADTKRGFGLTAQSSLESLMTPLSADAPASERDLEAMTKGILANNLQKDSPQTPLKGDHKSETIRTQ